jgi:hypothetical protein
VKVIENGDGTLDAKVGWAEIIKVAGMVAIMLTLGVTGLKFLGLTPASSKDFESRLTRTEANLETLTLTVGLLVAREQISTTDTLNRLVAIESSRFTSADGVALRDQLTALQQQVIHLPPEEWRRRVQSVEVFLARKFPEDWD